MLAQNVARKPVSMFPLSKVKAQHVVLADLGL
jgi:hypothetical protein